MAKSILVVGLKKELFEEIDPLLNRSHFTVDRVARGKSGLALGVGERLDLLRRHARGKDSAVLAVTEPRAVLEEVAARLLGGASRSAVRFMVRLRVGLSTGEQTILCQTDNVSSHGMLVRTSSPLPVGTRLAFEYNLPGDRQPIQGEAEVVRHTASQIGEVPGMELKSLALKGDGAARLRAFLETQHDSR